MEVGKPVSRTKPRVYTISLPISLVKPRKFIPLPCKIIPKREGYIKVTVRVNTRVYRFITPFNQRDKYVYNEVQIGGVK